MGAIGDIVATTAIDDSKWEAGAIRMQRSLGDIRGSADKAGAGISGGLGRGIGQVGFAVQDFSSVLSMGGKNALGRAMMSTMNNVQMLGAAFGPVGLAVTAVGGALGSMLIPKLLEGGEATQTFAERMKNAIAETVMMNDKAMQLSKTLQALGNVKTAKGMEERLGDLDKDEKMIARSKKRLERALNDEYRMAVKAGLLQETAGPDESIIGKAILTKEQLVWKEWTKVPEWVDERGAADAKTALKEGIKEFRKLEEQERTIKMQRDAGRVQLVALQKQDKVAAVEKAQEAEFQGRLDRFGAQQAERQKEEERRAQDAERVRKEVRTPMEVLRDRLAELGEMRAQGSIDNNLFERAADKALDGFEKKFDAKHGDKSLKGDLRDSKEAFSSVQAAIREAMFGGKADEETRLAREAVDIAKRQARDVEELVDQGAMVAQF